LSGLFGIKGHYYITMLSAKKAGQRALIVSGGDRILSNVLEELWIFTIVKMRFGMFEVKYQPKLGQCSLGAYCSRER
jgi:hypothetical protein